MALIFYLSAQPDLPSPAAGLLGTLFSSGSHALEYGVLAVLLAVALDGSRRPILVSFVVTALYALSDEFHQTFVPGRVADPRDLVCDVAGALVGLALWAAWRRRSSRPRIKSPG